MSAATVRPGASACRGADRGGGDAGHAVVGLDQVRGPRNPGQPVVDRLVRRGDLPIVAGIAAASAGLDIAILAADGATTIGIGTGAALYGAVSVCLLASAILLSGKMSGLARRPAGNAGRSDGPSVHGAIVLPVYPVPALTLVLALGLAAEFRAEVASHRPQVREEAPGPVWSRRARRKQRGGEGMASHRGRPPGTSRARRRGRDLSGVPYAATCVHGVPGIGSPAVALSCPGARRCPTERRSAMAMAGLPLSRTAGSPLLAAPRITSLTPA